jgi:hypothetical protein
MISQIKGRRRNGQLALTPKCRRPPAWRGCVRMDVIEIRKLDKIETTNFCNDNA